MRKVILLLLLLSMMNCAALARENFRIFEEGVEQRIAYSATAEVPFTVDIVPALILCRQ